MLETISCRDQTSDMQTSFWEAFQHLRIPLTLQGHTVMEIYLTQCFYSKWEFLQISVGGFGRITLSALTHKSDG